MNKLLRTVIGLTIVLVTIVTVVIYFIKHHQLISDLGNISAFTMVSVFLLYMVMLGVLLLILDATLRICFKKLPPHENLILNTYTLLINYFFPGQGGPIFRGAYLKKRHNLKIRNYTVATLIYYTIYAILSVILIALGSRPWWQTLVIGVLACLSISTVAYLYINRKKVKKSELNINLSSISYLLLATCTQLVIQIIIYSVELHSAKQNVRLSQVITYTGIANLALFVSLTPGAIGIRESFLILTEKINHITSSGILIANVIDRSVYLIFIIILIPTTLILATNNRFGYMKKYLPKLNLKKS